MRPGYLNGFGQSSGDVALALNTLNTLTNVLTNPNVNKPDGTPCDLIPAQGCGTQIPMTDPMCGNGKGIVRSGQCIADPSMQASSILIPALVVLGLGAAAYFFMGKK